jgi:hypothetical protein
MDESIKLLLNASEVTLLAIALVFAIRYLAKGRGKATADEAATTLKREENEGKLIEAVSESVKTQSDMKALLAKAVDLQADTVEWHKRHDAKIDDTNSALVNLNKSVKERSELDGQAIEELRDDVKRGQDKTAESITELKASIAKLTAQITKWLTDDRDCVSATEELKAIEDRIVTRLQQPVNAVATHTLMVDVAPPKLENAA